MYDTLITKKKTPVFCFVCHVAPHSSTNRASAPHHSPHPP
jgi:hypothetical protein